MKKFIQGCLFIILAIPVLDGLVSLFQAVIEFLSVSVASKTYQIQKSISDDENAQEENTYAIGFRMHDEKEYEDEEYDD